MKLTSDALTSDLLESLLATNDQEVYIEFVPTNRFEPGLFTAFLQVICSKLRTDPNFAINTNIDSVDEQNILQNFHHYYHLLSLLIFKNNLIVRDKNGFMLKRDRIISNAEQQFHLQDEVYSLNFEDQRIAPDSPLYKIQELQRRTFSDRSQSKINGGVSLFIPCFDHSRVLKESSYFYDNEGRLRGKDEVGSWVSKLFRYNHLNIRTGIERNNTPEDVAIVIKELFDNTEEWAKSTYDNSSMYSQNVRACFINVLLQNGLHRQDYDTTNRLQQYVRSITHNEISDLRIPNWQSEIYSKYNVGVCEISILDTGPGMARRWLRKDYDEFDERDEKIAVNRCFNKYVTSDQTGRSQVRGRGLNNVIRIIGNNGFINVRTGRLSLTRNFFENSLNRTEVSEGLNFDFENTARIEGTSITILYPFIYQE
jgi:hypothetical protein